MEEGGAKPRVNGSMLREYQGKNVCLIGTVSNVDKSGYSFQLTTSDQQNVAVRLQEPLQDMIAGVVEIIGMVTGPSQVTCSGYIQFSDEMSQSFDMEQYNKAVTLMHKFPDQTFTAWQCYKAKDFLRDSATR